MKSGSTILVIGATGAMGTQVIKSLLDDSTNQWKILALSRYPRSSRARALTELSSRVKLIEGNSNDSSTIKEALENVQGVFCNTDFWTSGKETEIRQGKIIAEACKWKNIEHFVYSSLDHTFIISGKTILVDPFDAKAEVEAFITSRIKGGDIWYQKHTTTLVTLPYMENFMSLYPPVYENNQYVFKLPLADKEWPMVALEDIGWFASEIFAHPTKYLGKTIKIGSESLPMGAIAAQFSEVTGLPASYLPISLEEFENSSQNQKYGTKIFNFLQEMNLKRDYANLRDIHPQLLTFKKWLQKTGWRGEQREVQKSFAENKYQN